VLIPGTEAGSTLTTNKLMKMTMMMLINCVVQRRRTNFFVIIITSFFKSDAATFNASFSLLSDTGTDYPTSTEFRSAVD